MVHIPEALRQPTLKLADHLEEMAESETAVYPTGLRRLDSWIDGGFSPGTLTLLAGLQNAGKSSILQLLMRGMIQESPNVLALSFALDDSKLTAASRWCADLGKVSIAAIKQKAHRSSPEEAARVQDGYAKFREICQRLMIYGASDIDSKLDVLADQVGKTFDIVSSEQGERPQLVVCIDSTRNLDWSHIQGLAANPTAATEYAMRHVKAMQDMEVNGVRVDPIIIVTEHLKKLDPKNFRRPSVMDIKDSIGPLYDANLILMLWNDLAACSTIAGRESPLWFPRHDKHVPGGDASEVWKDPIIDLSLAKNKMGAMVYGSRNSYLFMKLYQEQTRAEPITDPDELLRYGQYLNE